MLFFEKKNRNFQYLTGLTRLNLTPSVLYSYIESLKTESLYHPILWLKYFRIADKVEKEDAEMISLAQGVAEKKQALEQLQIAHKEQWNAFRNYCKNNNPQYKKIIKDMIFQNRTPYQTDTIDEAVIKRLADQYSQRLISYFES